MKVIPILSTDTATHQFHLPRLTTLTTLPLLPIPDSRLPIPDSLETDIIKQFA
ncbi:hypothetical protein [Moorena producens]|uniref:hypothetical protein n=1 Tax=Moorena producens TaxID=1155739 RepID=UPI003C75FFFE